MRLLLDTHVLLWWLDRYQAIPVKTQKILEDGHHTVFVSAVTAWEITIKQALGKLHAPDTLEEALAVNHFLPLPISFQHAVVAGRLPRYHDDPFDRMLIAQAQTENLTCVTHDERFRKYDVSILWNKP